MEVLAGLATAHDADRIGLREPVEVTKRTPLVDAIGTEIQRVEDEQDGTVVEQFIQGDVPGDEGGDTGRGQFADEATGERSDGPSTRNFDRMAARRDVAYVVSRIARADPDAFGRVLGHAVHIVGDDTIHDPETSYKHHLVDALDVVGRADTRRTTSTLQRRIESGDPLERERTLYALYHLEGRYVNDHHPILDDRSLRDAVSTVADDEVEAVRSAVADVEMVRDFGK